MRLRSPLEGHLRMRGWATLISPDSQLRGGSITAADVSAVKTRQIWVLLLIAIAVLVAWGALALAGRTGNDACVGKRADWRFE